MSNLPPAVSTELARPLAPPLSAEQLTALRRAVLKKGAEINDKLTKLLAGEKVSIEDLVSGGRPGETPIERLRRFMALVDRALLAMKSGLYGHCQRCGQWLGYDDLTGMPWLETCRSCSPQA